MARVKGLDPAREISLVRASGRVETRVARFRELCSGAAALIVRWSLDELPAVLSELGVRAPLLIASDRWRDLQLGIEPVAVWNEVPTERVGEVAGAGRVRM